MTPDGELDPEEREMMDLLLAFTRGLEGWGLRANQAEMTAAVHVLQGFVVHHMLQRIAPQAWSGWYAPSTPNSEGKQWREFVAEAETLGITPGPGEQPSQFRERVALADEVSWGRTMRVSPWDHPAR